METGNSQRTESMLLSDAGVRVAYAVEEDVVHTDMDGQGQDEFHGVARRGRKRAFAIRHHQVESAGGGQRRREADTGVRVGIEHVLEQIGGLGTDDMATSSGGIQGGLVDGSICDHGGSTTPRVVENQEQVNSIRMGRGGHALTLDASMITMMAQTSHQRGGGSSTRTRRGASRTQTTQPKRRRQQPAQLPSSRGGRRCIRGLGERILATQGHPASSVSPIGGKTIQDMDEFLSAMPPASQHAPSRARMRAPATLTQLADSLEDRLQVIASLKSSTVSTLKLRLESVHAEHGKMMCMCWCENPMGVFSGNHVVAVISHMPELEDFVVHRNSLFSSEICIDGHGIIVSKPWMVLNDQQQDEKRPAILLCLGDIAHFG